MTAGMIAVPTIIPLKEPGSILAGSRKWMIDTDTLIDLHTSSKDCLLFYTLDTTKPDPFKRTGNRTTHQFYKPFTLRTGKITVKALAVLKDGSRESNINTKVFQVDQPEIRSDDDDSINRTNTSWATQNDSDDETEDIEERKLFRNVLRDPPGGKSSKQGKENNLIKKVLTDSPRTPVQPPVHNSNDDDSFRCVYCNTERPRDPFARFCNGCGRSLPPAPGGIRRSQYFNNVVVNCENCGYEKSSESSFCKVCDSITKCNKPLKQRINCTNCDSMNPVTVENCLVCDQDLDNKLLQNNKINKSIIHKPCSNFIQCPFCERTNSGDARYCDWCGKKPETAPPRIFKCQECKVENTLYSEYCCSCSKILKTPPRKSFEDHLYSGNFTVEDSDDLNTDDVDSNKAPWKNIKLKKVAKRQSKNISTQAGENLLPSTPLSKSKLNPSFNFSPGKGYWRQQIEHICHHLKIYTQNNLEFRESISNYVMSRMISGIVGESEEAQLVVSATFALKDGKKKMKTFNEAANALTFINALTSSVDSKNQKRGSIQSTTKPLLSSRPTSARSTARSGSAAARSRPGSAARSRPGSATRSRPSSARSTTSKAGSTKRKKTRQKSFENFEKEKMAERLAKLSAENLKILNMIKSSKVIDEEKVEELMKSEKFDANANDENDTPLLKVSVINKHYTMIPLLINAGAQVDKTSGTKETSALHEAVLLGINGRDAVSALIENGASADLKDKKGLSAFDIAVESGIDSLIEKFTKLTSKQMLDDVRL